MLKQTTKRQEAAQLGALAALLGALDEGVGIVGADGLVALWNPAAEAITGLAAEDVVGLPLSTSVPGWNLLQRLVANAGHDAAAPLPVEIAGRELWLAITAVEVDEGTAYVFRDRTADRSLEQLKADFIATVSHELRTPLTSIQGAALTMQNVKVDSPELREQLLGMVVAGASRLTEILDDLVLAKELAADAHGDGAECDAGEQARELVAAAQAERADVSVRLAAPPRLPRVATSSGVVRRVLGALLDNAVKYGGELVDVALEVAGDSLRITVEDDGPGIPAADRTRIFDRFSRLDPDMLRGVGGLGLYLSRSLVNRAGGRIQVESAPGSGARFVVELPLVAAAW